MWTPPHALGQGTPDPVRDSVPPEAPNANPTAHKPAAHLAVKVASKERSSTRKEALSHKSCDAIGTNAGERADFRARKEGKEEGGGWRVRSAIRDALNCKTSWTPQLYANMKMTRLR
ncbi:hypothetical protein J6590_053982 [Homalodisca vitripennis]|nr:hypothetical protein J6590_053982 [Homalodisca vitripennis]